MELERLRDNLGGGAASMDVRLFEIAGTPITPATLATFLVIIALTFVVSALLQRAVVRALRLRRVADEGSVSVARRLVHYLVIALGLGVGIQTIGIDLSALFAAGAVFAIGLGFAMQNIAQNFVSGLILLVERTIKPGDVLQIETQFVRVERMGIRATLAKTLDDEEIIIPNSTIVQGTVKNFTLRDSLYRLRCSVGVSYASDMRVVRRTLEQVAAEVPFRAAEKEPIVLLTGFGSSSVDFEVSVWIDDPWLVARRRSALNESIWWALKDVGVTIAFPQVDVHFDPPLVASLEGLRRAG